MQGYINEDGKCGDLEHCKSSYQVNSKWGRLYKLDPRYRNGMKYHKESCDTCKKLTEVKNR